MADTAASDQGVPMDVADTTAEGATKRPRFPIPYDERIKHVTAIAKPLASEKLTTRLYKLIGKAKRQKDHLRPGLKEVQKRIRKGERGMIVLAGDAQPIDCMAHMPALCEEHSIPYCYVPSRQDIGWAMGSRRKVMMVMIRPHADYQKIYDKCKSSVDDLELPI